MTTYTCIQKYVDKHGNARSYVLQDERGGTGEFKREAVLCLLQNRNFKFTNLKLTSDGKIIFTKDDAKVESVNALKVHPSAVLAVLINQIDKDDKASNSYSDSFIADLNGGMAGGNYRDTLEKWLYSVEVGISHDSYLRFTCKAAWMQLLGVYKNSNNEVIGYKIKNVSNTNIMCIKHNYSLNNGTFTFTSRTKKMILPNEEVALNKIDAIRLISQPGFGGMWSNTLLKGPYLQRPIVNHDDFIWSCRLEDGGRPVLNDRQKREVEESLGINRKTHRSNGVFNFFKRK